MLAAHSLRQTCMKWGPPQKGGERVVLRKAFLLVNLKADCRIKIIFKIVIFQLEGNWQLHNFYFVHIFFVKLSFCASLLCPFPPMSRSLLSPPCYFGSSEHAKLWTREEGLTFRNGRRGPFLGEWHIGRPHPFFLGRETH